MQMVIFCLAFNTRDLYGLTEIAGHENAGHEFARHDKYCMKLAYIT